MKKKSFAKKKTRKSLVLKKEDVKVYGGSGACGWCTCCGKLVRCGH